VRLLGLIILGFFAVPAFAGSYMLLPIDEVYDGDTLVTHIHPTKLPPPLNIIRIRVRGIDTPEMPVKSFATTYKLGRAECMEEAFTAIAARNAIQMLVNEAPTKTMKVSNFEWGKYGGRVVADVKINGQDIATYLLERRYAVRYDGKTKTHDWCE